MVEMFGGRVWRMGFAAAGREPSMGMMQEM